MRGVSVSISVSDLDYGSFPGYGAFSRDVTSLCGKWLPSSFICVSSIICPSRILNV